MSAPVWGDGGQQADGCMCVQVLTTGSWPTQSSAKCSLPRELERGCEDFKAFYLASHSGRKLSWQTNMGNTGALAPGARPASCSPAAHTQVSQPCQPHAGMCHPVPASAGAVSARVFFLGPISSADACAMPGELPGLLRRPSHAGCVVCPERLLSCRLLRRHAGDLRGEAARAQREHVPDGHPAALQRGGPAQLCRHPARDLHPACGPQALPPVAGLCQGAAHRAFYSYCAHASQRSGMVPSLDIFNCPMCHHSPVL